MSKLLTILLAGAFATGAAVAQTAPSSSTDKSTSTARSGTDSTRSSTTASGAGSGSTAQGTGSGKTAAAGGDSGNTTAANGKSKTDKESSSAMGAAGDSTFCPPGLDKKDNNCMPPGQAKKSDTLSTTDKAMHSGKAKGENAQDKTDKTAR